MNDFTHPVFYTVYAEDGTHKTYTITVNRAASEEKALTAFLTPEAPVEDTHFGYSVDLSDDGKITLIGAYSEETTTPDLAYIFETASSWTNTPETAILNFSQG